MKKMLTMVSLLVSSISFAYEDRDILRFVKLNSEDAEKIVYSIEDCYGKECMNRGKLIFAKTQTNDAAVAAKICENNKAESFDEVEVPLLLFSALIQPSKDSVALARKLEKEEGKFVYWNAGESVGVFALNAKGEVNLDILSSEEAKKQDIKANVLCKIDE